MKIHKSHHVWGNVYVMVALHYRKEKRIRKVGNEDLLGRRGHERDEKHIYLPHRWGVLAM